MKHTFQHTSLCILALILAIFPMATMAETTPNTIVYEGLLLDSSGNARTTTHTIRFSFWKSGDWVSTDTATGAINTSASNYGGWYETQSFTPNSDGRFSVKLGDGTALPTPDFVNHKYLQVEIKNAAEADTAYQLMDPSNDSGADSDDRKVIGSSFYSRNAERVQDRTIGTGSGNLIVLGFDGKIGLAQMGSGTETLGFTINANNDAADAVLTFGNDLGAEMLTFSDTNNRFEFTDDLYVAGTLTVTGAMSGASLTVTGLKNCDTIDTDANGNLVCGTDAGSGMSQSEADARFVNQAGDTMTGALKIDFSGVGLNVTGTMSGRSLQVTGTGADPLIFTDTTNDRIGFGTTTPDQFVHLSRTGSDTAVLFQTRNVSVANNKMTGLNSPSTAVDDASIGTIAWTDTGNATASDNTYATVTLTDGNISHYIKATNFGFSIPSNTTIQGIIVEWEKKDIQTSVHSIDNAVRIVKGGTIGSTDKSNTSEWPTTDTYVAHGSNTDLWGETWTSSDINASSFGTAISAKCTGSCTAGDPEVDHVRIRVYYSESSTTEDMKWTLGTDDSDSGTFKISNSGALGVRDFLSITNTGSVGIGDSSQITSPNLPGGSLVVDHGALCVDDGSGRCDNAPRDPGEIYALALNAPFTDLAENYPTDDATIEAGDVVALTGSKIMKSTAPYESTLFGVVSTDPGVTLGMESSMTRPIALTGRVPTKVSMENGTIAEGDLLTSSSTAGYAMKATRDGNTIGMALESATSTGSINVAINLGYHIPGETMKNLKVEDDMTLNSNNTAADAILTFGNDLGVEMLKFSDTNNRFEFTDDLHVEGNLEVTGTISGHLLPTPSSAPPFACSSSHAGMLWADTDTGIVYTCDTSNSRNKWLTMQNATMGGTIGGICQSGNDISNDKDCTVQTADSLEVGLYLGNPITITGYGFTQKDDTCISGSFDIEVWSTGSSSNDETYSLDQVIASGLTGEAENSTGLNIDINGGQYIRLGIDNNCSSSIKRWSAIFYYKERHD